MNVDKATIIRSPRSAFTLMEVIMATFIVGTILVVALQTVGAATQGQYRNGNRSRAH